MRGILIKAAEKKVVAVDVKPDPNRSREGLRALAGASGAGELLWATA